MRPLLQHEAAEAAVAEGVEGAAERQLLIAQAHHQHVYIYVCMCVCVFVLSAVCVRAKV